MKLNNKKFCVAYLGCKVNAYEVEAIKTKFEKEGLIYSEENPDIIIVNTCSVTSISDKKSRNLLRYYKKTFPNACVCAMGCSSQQFNLENVKTLGIDIAIGNDKKSNILSILEDFFDNNQPICLTNNNFRNFEYDEIEKISSFEQIRAYVKIQDGCDNFCSYCLIPYIRGRARSRKPDCILKEINNLIDGGYKEIVLTGIDVASYGLDLDPKLTFSNLLELILSKTPKLYRLRISSIEESMIDEKFINLLKNYQNIANHMHLSLQSGSDKILKLMNRKYNTQEFYSKVKLIKSARPDMCLTTDIIVGFPGESEQDFVDSYEFAKKCKFAKIHVFPYSIRKGTVAEKMKDQINPAIKKSRVNELLKLSKDLENEYIKQFIGKEIDFLVEKYDSISKKIIGHTSNYIECMANGCENDVNKVVKIVATFDNVKIS